MSKLPVSAEVGAAIQTVYGDNGYARFCELAENNSQLDGNNLLAKYRSCPTPLYTYFTRNSHTIEGFAQSERLGRMNGDVPDEVVRINHVGGILESWAIAATLLQYRLSDVSVRSFEINPAEVKRAYGPIAHSFAEILQYGSWREASLARYFEERSDGVAPKADFAGKAVFQCQDIITQPLPEEPVDALAIFNVLWHYPADTRNHIMVNTFRLRPNGAFLYEGLTRDSRQASDYKKWIGALGEYGLCWPDEGMNRVLRYKPDCAERTFTTVPAVEDALGVLALAQQP